MYKTYVEIKPRRKGLVQAALQRTAWTFLEQDAFERFERWQHYRLCEVSRFPDVAMWVDDCHSGTKATPIKCKVLYHWPAPEDIYAQLGNPHGKYEFLPEEAVKMLIIVLKISTWKNCQQLQMVVRSLAPLVLIDEGSAPPVKFSWANSDNAAVFLRQETCSNYHFLYCRIGSRQSPLTTILHPDVQHPPDKLVKTMVNRENMIYRCEHGNFLA